MSDSNVVAEARLRAGFVGRGVIVGVLGVVILGAIVLTVYLLLAGGEGSYAVHTEGMHFVCGKCGGEFVKEFSELDPGQQNTRVASLRVDCPECGAKAAGIAALACPNCGAYYAPASHTDPAAKAAGRAKDICPKCKTDRDEWFRKRYRGRR